MNTAFRPFRSFEGCETNHVSLFTIESYIADYIPRFTISSTVSMVIQFLQPLDRRYPVYSPVMVTRYTNGLKVINI